MMPRAKHVKHHWVRLQDEDLAYILDGPDEDAESDGDSLFVWIDAVLNIIENGLETA
jgi:hypothetical protein